MSEGDSSAQEESWIPWFCNRTGNDIFCEIEKGYIEDTFNLFGLKMYFQRDDYNKALDVILDRTGSYVLNDCFRDSGGVKLPWCPDTSCFVSHRLAMCDCLHPPSLHTIIPYMDTD